MLRLWIEAQPMPVIALVVFGLAYVFAAVVFVLVTNAPERCTHHFRQLSPVTVTSMAVVLGVLLGFVAARVWANFDRAIGYVGREASALAEVLVLADSLPPDVKASLRNAVAAHVKAVEEEEWPAMARRETIARHSPHALTHAVAAILAFTPERTGEQLAQSRALVALETALEARRNRIMLSGVTLERTQWWVIMGLFVLVIATVAMVHVGNPISNAIALFLVASAAATSFVLLLAYDHPLSALGGIFVKPTLLRDILAY
jgi:hypothetical protein